MDSTYFSAQALYQFGARALGMGPSSSSQRAEITSGSSEAPGLPRQSHTSYPMDIDSTGSPTATITSVTFSSTSLSMQPSNLASRHPFPSIPGDFSFPPSLSPAQNTQPPIIYPSIPPSYPSPIEAPESSARSSESSAKVRLLEAPSIRVENLQRRLRTEQAKSSAASQKQRQRQRLAIETARETAREATTMQYAQNIEMWEQRAARYEQQLQAQEARLAQVTAEHVAVTNELHGALNARGEQLAFLQSSVQEKDAVINQIRAGCQHLSARLEDVQLELDKERDTAATIRLEMRHERETAAAEREREMLALEERMTRTFQTAPYRPSSAATSRRRQPLSPIPADDSSDSSSTPERFTATSRRRQPLSPILADDSSESSSTPECTPPPDESISDNFGDIPERQPSTLPPDRMPCLVKRTHPDARAVAKAVADEKKSVGRENRNEHLKQVRAVFAEFLGAPEDEDFVSGHIAASRDVVEAYLNGKGFGPDRNDLHFSDLPPHRNAWNRAVAAELGAILFARQRSGKWRLPDGSRVSLASQPYWEDAVLEKFYRQCTRWVMAKRQVVTDASTGLRRQESWTETNTRRCLEAEEQHRLGRQRERRGKRWERRKTTCEAKITFTTTTFDRNQWKQFLEIIKTLGKEGMSSDESTAEEATHRPCYRVSVFPWRRDFDAIMDKIDAERFGPQSGYSARGSRPTPRHRQDRAGADDIHLSHREPVLGLPVSFYDEQWLEGCSSDYIERVLCVSEEAFDWVVQIANLYGTSST
ncbi:hypothetical protein LXA43DRAFT_1068378 [Ganoderma leucocontextum]|nr:hypothetical protein LXA43DRAFT_1068378 [Ganoderma leucocontextum]